MTRMSFPTILNTIYCNGGMHNCVITSVVICFRKDDTTTSDFMICQVPIDDTAVKSGETIMVCDHNL